MTSYVLEARTPFGGDVATMVSTSDPSLYTTMPSKEYMGHSFDPVTRRIYYSASVLVTTNEDFPDGIVNPSAHNVFVSGGNFILDYTVDDFVDTIAPGDLFQGLFAMNYYLCYKDIDTDAVTMIGVYDDNATLPSGIGGSDGTYRMCCAASDSVVQQFKLVDPRTANCWNHTTSPACSIYLFEDANGYKQTLLPFPSRATPTTANHMEMLGTTSDWMLVMGSSTTSRTDGALYTVPRVTTADEIANGQKLGYFYVAEPTWMNAAYWRSCVCANDGNAYIFGSARTGSRDYRLYKYAPPSSIGSWTGSTQAGGTFTDVTPWASATGPNTDVGAYIFDHLNSGSGGRSNNTDGILQWARHLMLPLPAAGDAGQLALISILDPQSTTSGGSEHDPTLFRADCTYYDLAAGSFDYHAGFVAGLMTADWTPASGLSDAAFAVQFVREINPYLAYHAYDFTSVSGDYSHRWLAFSVQPVTDGSFTWDVSGASNSTVLAQYHFVSGAAPALETVYFDALWLPAYTAYAARIGNDNIVEQSVGFLGEWGGTGGAAGSSEQYVTETGVYDAISTPCFWFGGFNRNSVQIDTSMPTWRGTSNRAIADEFVRLSIGASPMPTRPAYVWSRIGRPGL